jgi:hypothetical protein
MADVAKVMVRKTVVAKVPQVKYMSNGQVQSAIKLPLDGFTEYHHRVIRGLAMNRNGELVFSEQGWSSIWLGAGEEKSVYLIIDPHGYAFAMELLGRDGYKNGELVEGHYFMEVFLPKISGHLWHSEAIFGHTFSGVAKIREFIYGEILAGTAYRDHYGECEPDPNIPATHRFITSISRRLARWLLSGSYWKIKRRFQDTHEANVMIELIPLHNPENKAHCPLPLPWAEADGTLKWWYVRLTAIDVRTNN